MPGAMIFVFDDFQLDPQKRELVSSTGPVAVEPRVLDALTYLIRHRDRVVSKDELLQQVWQAEHLSDGAVARCIMEARRAVGDDGEGRVIKTAHGRGYRFIASVEEVGSKSAVVSPRRRRMGITVGLAALIGGGIWWFGRGPAEPDVASPPSLMLLETTSGGEEMEWFGKSLEDALRLRFAESPDLDLLEDDPASTGDAEAVLRQRGDLDGVVWADISAADIEGFARLEVQLMRTLAAGNIEYTPLGTLILPRFNPVSEPESFDSIRGAVVGTVTPRLLATLNPERSADPTSRESWQLYLRAVTQWEPMCEAGAAEDMVRRSLELTPEFAPAWTLLAYLRLTQAKFCAGMMDAMPDIRDISDRLFEVDAGSSTPFAYRATVELYQGMVGGAWKTLESAPTPRRQSLAIRLGQSTLLRYVGELEESKEIFDGVVADLPSLPYVAGFVPYAYRYLGDWEGFLSLMTGQESPHFRFYRGLAEHMLGNDETAIDVLQPAFAAHPGDLYGRLCQALLAIVQGNVDEARVLLIQLARQRATAGSLDGEVTFEIAHLMALAGETDPALDQLTLAVEQGFSCVVCIEDDSAFADLKALPGYPSVIERALLDQAAFEQLRAEVASSRVGD
jgi:DNA-binding winged helix-turn-helix (wHTH) protein/tetratricopeptide (TPR) repeat protein